MLLALFVAKFKIEVFIDSIELYKAVNLLGFFSGFTFLSIPSTHTALPSFKPCCCSGERGAFFNVLWNIDFGESYSFKAVR